MKFKGLISIVVPVYNSVETIRLLFERIQTALERHQFEVILVDDGSVDGSWPAIVRLKSEHPHYIRAIRLSRNFGQHKALICGISFSTGDVVVTIDDDLQHPPSEILKLLDTYEKHKADVVYGVYEVKKHSWLRNKGSQFVRKSGRLLTGTTGMGSSFRLLSRTIVDGILAHRHQELVFIDELLHWYTGNFAVVQVEHRERELGSSGYSIINLVVMYFDILINYTALPLKLMTWVGLLSSFITFLTGGYFVFLKLFHDVKPGFTAQIVTILFSTSLLMFCMGIIGQYLYKIYHLQSQKPAWAIREVL